MKLKTKLAIFHFICYFSVLLIISFSSIFLWLDYQKQNVEFFRKEFLEEGFRYIDKEQELFFMLLECRFKDVSQVPIGEFLEYLREVGKGNAIAVNYRGDSLLPQTTSRDLLSIISKKIIEKKLNEMILSYESTFFLDNYADLQNSRTANIKLKRAGFKIYSSIEMVIGYGGVVDSITPRTSYFERVNGKLIFNQILFSMIISIVSIACVLGFTFFIIHRTVSKPLELLIRYAGEIRRSGGHVGQIEIISSSDDMGVLCKAFNQMAESIRHYSLNLEELVMVRTKELHQSNKVLKQVNLQMKEELITARNVQKAIMPKSFPCIPGVSIAGIYKPLDILSGDLYDVILLGGGKVGFIIMDVCGHGVTAALLTIMAKMAFQTHASSTRSTAETLKRINREVFAAVGKLQTFITVFYGIIDLESRTLEYTNAAHTDAFILSREGAVTRLEANSIFVGFVKKPDSPFESQKVILEPGDRIFLYTDGILELRNEEGEFFEEERFLDTLKNNTTCTLEESVRKVINRGMTFAGKVEIEDDISLLFIEVE